MKCKFCEREISNKGSMTAHEMCCKNNPNRIKHKHSPLAGAKKGNVSWNKGKTFKDANFERTVALINSDEWNTLSEITARRHAKRYLLTTLGNRCSICGITEWQDQSVPLVCDHISGDSSDNRIENFRLVCCNCDAQLPTYKSKNKGRGRKYDREYKQKVSALKDSIK